MIKSRRMRQMGHVACMGEIRSSYKISLSKSEPKRTLGRPVCRWKDNRPIKTDLRETGYESMNWIQLAQERV
jgi:hypothetical protein